ncbi:tetratricopeptide repeat protein [Gulosibacter macacae]|uniref:Tetratricopeptide repeat protein n=1 Tax=Gulosibacter macacae TaxID=2488791 RepID=A0A3P3VVB3_9MICO|nr:tetratricopeptide repeat protein [Gulosibacter macacae]RRJ86745.1 tetratricopeptide repeat protein [Gulosibacter macacae]
MSDSPIILGYDPETLRERIDPDAAAARYGEIERFRSLTALNERVALLRLLGRYDEAYDCAQAACRQSRFTGSREDSLAARVRRAQVEQYRGNLDIALQELTNCVDEAVAHEWGELAGFALQHRGKVLFDLERYEDALADFERALKYREAEGIPADQTNSTRFAIKVVRARIEGAAQPDEHEEPITSIDA